MKYLLIPILILSFLTCPVYAETVDEKEFSITFPSTPTKNVVNVTEGMVITNYQASDGEGLYTFSLGEMDKTIRDEIKESFLENMFQNLLSTAPETKVYTKDISYERTYFLSYTYTSKLHQGDWIHTGMIFFVDDNSYMKITLIYPKNLIDEAEKKYTEFLNSLKLKDK